MGLGTRVLNVLAICKAIGDAKFRQGVRPGLKFSSRISSGRKLRMPGSDQAITVYYILAACGGLGMLAGLDAGLTRFRTVPVLSRAWPHGSHDANESKTGQYK